MTSPHSWDPFCMQLPGQQASWFCFSGVTSDCIFLLISKVEILIFLSLYIHAFRITTDFMASNMTDTLKLLKNFFFCPSCLSSREIYPAACLVVHLYVYKDHHT